jgi:hypothetical protein
MFRRRLQSVTPWRSVNSYRLFGRIWWIFSVWAALKPENGPSLLSQYAANLTDKVAYGSDFCFKEYSEMWGSQRSPCHGLCRFGTSDFRGLLCILMLFQILWIHSTLIIRPSYVWTASVHANTLEWHINSGNNNCTQKQWNSFKMRSI